MDASDRWFFCIGLLFENLRWNTSRSVIRVKQPNFKYSFDVVFDCCAFLCQLHGINIKKGSIEWPTRSSNLNPCDFGTYVESVERKSVYSVTLMYRTLKELIVGSCYALSIPQLQIHVRDKPCWGWLS